MIPGAVAAAALVLACPVDESGFDMVVSVVRLTEEEWREMGDEREPDLESEGGRVERDEWVMDLPEGGKMCPDAGKEQISIWEGRKEGERGEKGGRTNAERQVGKGRNKTVS